MSTTATLANEKQTQGVTELRDVSVTFTLPNGSPNNVLSDFSLTAQAGEIVVLVGRSGCGKTTVLNLVAGLLDATSGSVSVSGKKPAEARRSLAYMFARDALIPWRTVARNVEFPLEVRGGHSRAERREIARSYLALVGLAGQEDQYPGQLSQGMRQRVALARTWALQPQVLLMDEPFGALDALTRVSVQEEFLNLWSRDKPTVLFVTHDLDEAVLMGDRVLVIADGRVVLERSIQFPRPRRLHELAANADYRELSASLRDALGSAPRGGA